MELQFIQSKIYEIRGQKVMLDRDLAELYGIETKRLKEAVRRNLRRFPVDFMFELNRKEFDVANCVLKRAGWIEVHAFCFYRTRSSYAFFSPE